MTRPTNLTQPLPNLTTGFLGREAPNPITDPPDPIDRAAGLEIFVPPTEGTATLVQEAEIDAALGGSVAIVLGSAPAEGNRLILAVVVRSPGGVTLDTPTGWTAHPDGTTFTTAENTSISTFYRLAAANETTTVGTVGSGSGGGSGWHAHVSEWSGTGDFDTSATANDDLVDTVSGGSVTPTAGVEALIYTAVAMSKGDGHNLTVTPDGDTTELWDKSLSSNRTPNGWAGYRIVSSASGAYELTGTMFTGASPVDHDFAGHALVFAGSNNPVNGGPLATDDDDTTYVESSGTLVLAIDLEDAYRIVRGRLFVGTDGSGARTYTLEGANAADFSDAVTLDTTAFTATGSFTGQEVLFSIASPDHYRYYRITSDTDEDVRVYTIELYEASVDDIGGVTDHGALDGLADNDHPQYALDADLDAHIVDTIDAHDASAISYDGYESGLDAIDVQAAIDEHIADHPGGTPTLDYGEDGDISTLDYDDTADAGVLDEVARADHVHGMPSEGSGSGLPAAKAWLEDNYANEDIPASPNATYDDEFDDTTGMSGATNGLNARWNWRNQETATATFELQGWLTLAPNSVNNASDWRIIEIAAFADGTYEAKFSLEGVQALGVGRSQAGGMVIVDGTNGDFHCLGYAWDNQTHFYGVQRWTDVNTFNANTSLVTMTAGMAPIPLIGRIVKSGTTVDFWTSYDGISFIRRFTQTDAIGATRIGIGCNENGSTGLTKLHVDYFRKVA